MGGRTVFHGGTVFDGTGADLAHTDVLIEDGRIVEIGSDIDADGGIDCAGKAVLPGLFDTHVHLVSRYEDFDEVRVMHEPFGAPFFRVTENLRRALIYPRTEFANDDEIEIRNSNVQIRRFALDLEVPGKSLLQEARGLVNRVLAWPAEGRCVSSRPAERWLPPLDDAARSRSACRRRSPRIGPRTGARVLSSGK